MDAAAQALELLLRQAVALHEAGRLQDAQEIYARIIRQDALHFDALHMHGVVLYQLGQFEPALQMLQLALQQRQKDAVAHSHLALVQRSLKRQQDALGSHEKALELQPNFPQAWANRGNVLRDLGRFVEAEASFRRSLEQQQDSPSALHGLGLSLGDQGKWEAALQAYDRALAIKPDHAVIYLDRGNALRELGRLPAALQSYDHAIELNPDYAQAWSNRGVVLRYLGRLDEALASYQRAMTITPAFIDAMVNCSTLLKEMMRLEDSIAMNAQALALDPACSGAHLNMAICRLLQGEFATGFRHYEWRWKTDQLRDGVRPFSQPLWLGQHPVRGLTVLLHAEQGLGDTLHFCRYAKLVASLGARVLLEVQPALVELLSGIDGVDAVIARGTALPAFDVHCPLLSLPLALETTVSSIPAPTAYVHPDTARLGVWMARLPKQEVPRVGLVWSGRPEHKNDHNRSIAFDDFSQAMAHRIDYHCLQKEFRETDLAAARLQGSITFWQEQLNTFSDTAALVERMDLVISVDTSVAHLAAAMGKPVWLLLPFSPDWRWLPGRNDTPWYPTMRLFRQSSTGDWTVTLQSVAQALMERYASRPVP